MTIELTREQERLIRDLVKTGRYTDDHAVLSRSLKLIQEYESKVSHLRAEIQKGEESGEHRPFDVEDTIKRARERLEQHTTDSTQLHRI